MLEWSMNLANNYSIKGLKEDQEYINDPAGSLAQEARLLTKIWKEHRDLDLYLELKRSEKYGYPEPNPEEEFYRDQWSCSEVLRRPLQSACSEVFGKRIEIHSYWSF